MAHLHERMSPLLLPCAKQVPEDTSPQEKDPFSEEEKCRKKKVVTARKCRQLSQRHASLQFCIIASHTINELH